MIDKHIRKLDSDLAKFESEMKVSSSVSSTSFTTVFVQDKGRLSQSESEEEEVVNKKKMKDKKKKGVKEEDNKKKKKAKKVRRRWKEKRLCNVFFPQVENLTTPLISYVGSGVPQEVLDMPVDPNEPTYCVCQQVSNYM